MSVQLKRLAVRNFRGIRDQVVSLDGKNLLLIGENGSGKSSFVDALDYLFTGELDRLKRQDVKEQQSIPFMGCKGGDVAIELDCQVEGSDAQLGVGYPYRVPGVPRRLQDWFTLARSRPFILRRAQILRFVEARGADRYKQVSTLIGLDDVDRIEETWRSLENEWKRREQTAASVVERAVQELRDLIGVERAEEPLIIKIANRKLGEAGAKPVGSIQELPQRRASIQFGAGATEAAKKAERLLTLVADLEQIAGKITGLLSHYTTFYYEEWERFVREKETLKDAIFRVFWEHGKRLLQEHPELEECPLCSAPIERETLMTVLQGRLEKLEGVRVQQQKLEDQVGLLRNEATILLGLGSRVSEVEDAAPVQGILAGLENGLGQFRDMLGQGVLDGQFPTPNALQQKEWAQAPAALAEKTRRMKKQVQASQPSESDRKRMEIFVWLGQVEVEWGEWQKRRGESERVRRVRQQVERVRATLIEARRRRLEEIHRRIEGLVNRYCERLHPGEGYGSVQLPMERSGKGVGLRTCFFEVENTHPLGFYSEGHLDSLGIVVFLAFIKEFNGDLNLLVLDDVFTTVDRSHRQRVASLLFDEFAGYQMILTTHDRLWAEELLTTMRAAGLQPVALNLRPWDVRRGVDWVEFVEERWNEYRERAETHVQSAVADTGRDLEKFLCRMRYHLLLSVPARLGDQYTIGDLYDPFFGWFKKRSVQCPEFDTRLEKLKAKLDVHWRQRNWAGAHYNEWGENLSATEAGDFIGLVEELANLFRCPGCGSLVEYDERAGVLFCCHCKGKPDGALWRVVRRTASR